MNVRKKNKTNQGYMEWLWKGRSTILDGVSKEGLSDEVTLAGSLKAKQKPDTCPLSTYAGETILSAFILWCYYSVVHLR